MSGILQFPRHCPMATHNNIMVPIVALVHSHHLLDHKPDNLVLKGGKLKLQGVACLGCPGVALCVRMAVDIANFHSWLEAVCITGVAIV